MAQFISIQNRFNNQDKRYAEAIVMTCPAMYEEGGQRAGTPPKYVTSGDSYTAQIVEPGTIVKKAYLVIDEAFPTGATISVDVAGNTFFSDAPADAKGITVSTLEDVHLANKQTISVMIVNGTEGTVIQEGVARVVFDTVSINLKNGNYSA